MPVAVMAVAMVAVAMVAVVKVQEGKAEEEREAAVEATAVLTAVASIRTKDVQCPRSIVLCLQYTDTADGRRLRAGHKRWSRGLRCRRTHCTIVADQGRGR